MSRSEREELLSHYAGAATWRDVCSALEVDYDLLPDTVTA
jgi:hypothetical protein